MIPVDSLTLECSIDQEPYDIETRYPVVLSCGHTLCVICSRRLPNKKCPFCKAEIANNQKRNFQLIETIKEIEKFNCRHEDKKKG